MCRELRSEWYQYLEKTGFTDIESLSGQVIDHKTQIDLAYRKDFHTQAQFEAKQNYYQWARGKLNDGRFNSERDKLIWEYHADGVSSRQISPRIGLEQSWLVRKINKIKEQLESIGSVSYAYA